MSAAENLKKLSPEDLHELASHIEGFLHKRKEDLKKDIAGSVHTVERDVEEHDRAIPTSCKIYGLLILLAASVGSYIFGRKSAE